MGFDKGVQVGILPLQYNEKSQAYEFFGGGYMEKNGVLIEDKYSNCIPQFYNFIDKHCNLNDIDGNDPFTQNFEFEEYKYTYNLLDISNIDELIAAKFKSKSKANLIKKIKQVEAKKPVVIENNFQDLNLLMELNKKNFGQDSSFNFPFREKIFADLLNLKLDFRMKTFLIQDQKASVSLSVKYGDTYTYMNAGTNKVDHPNLGTYVIWENIKQAINDKVEIFDAGVEDLGWKERWHLDRTPLYKFIKG
ncbi:GNAT family N-acetyltransferase [Patescibacteria group bacterium]|nr:GNAT family N-acetyltransferase [Patescibacteria group bacterium]